MSQLKGVLIKFAWERRDGFSCRRKKRGGPRSLKTGLYLFLFLISQEWSWCSGVKEVCPEVMVLMEEGTGERLRDWCLENGAAEERVKEPRRKGSMEGGSSHMPREHCLLGKQKFEGEG